MAPTTPPKTYDVVIVGGGIIGLSIAEQLSQSSRRIAVLDHRPVAYTASWAAAGILPPPIQRALHDPLEQLRDLSHQRYQRWCQRLSDEAKINVPYRRCGGIYLGRSVGERVSLRAALEQWQTDGVTVEAWSNTEVAKHEPRLVGLSGDADIFYLPQEAQVRPPRILKALRTILSQRGVEQLSSATPVRWEDPAAGTLQWEQGVVKGAQVCLSAGPWTQALLTDLGVYIPTEPRRGQMVLWKLKRPILRHIVNEGPRYLVSRRDGHLLAGSTVEDVGFDTRTTKVAIDNLVRFANGLLPELNELDPAATWAALRPMSVDGLPYLGDVPGHSQLFVATGHFRSGIHLAPATAELLAQRMTAQPLSMDLTDFRVNR